ncbi:MAG: CrcB family protein [Cyanobacteria bacterium RUI128]|nr:CrcB family protein [Cyanobacteria bacterium RUI128]
MLKEGLFIALGGGIGAVLRYVVSSVLNRCFKMEHWATFWVNVSGCFTLGLLFQLLMHSEHCLYIFVLVGIVGSYTTFSAFEYENIDLIAHERYLEFLKYSVYSCAFSFFAVAAGFYLGRILASFI